MAYGRCNLMGGDYAEMDRLALNILQDYSLFQFPLDVFYVAEKILKATIIKYSELTDKKRSELFDALTKKGYENLNKGFTVFEKMSNGSIHYIIYYNDSRDNLDCRYTIAHEIKHIVCNEENPTLEQENLAEYFAKIFIAPKVVALNENKLSQNDIIEYFGLTCIAAEFLSNGLTNRIDKKGKTFLEKYEEEYINLRNKCLNRGD